MQELLKIVSKIMSTWASCQILEHWQEAASNLQSARFKRRMESSIATDPPKLHSETLAPLALYTARLICMHDGSTPSISAGKLRL